MPFIVQDLIKDKPNLVTTELKEPVQQAMARMIEHDYSQLPIVDERNRPLGMITTESILRALNNFGVGLDKLRVEHARIRAETFRDDADLFELLDRLQTTYAVLIVDGDGQLSGIVTNYDTAEYFRRRAEDMMLVEDIETMVKDYIRIAYRTEVSQANQDKLEAAVQRITDSGQALRRKVERAIIHYLTLQSEPGQPPVPNKGWLKAVLDTSLSNERPSRQFEDLSLSDYITLLFDEHPWSHLKKVFNLEKEALRTLLDKVRQTRNALAHFRGEISAAERHHLHFTSNWLAQYQEAIIAAFEQVVMAGPPADRIAEEEHETVVVTSEEETEEIVPLDEAEPQESRYAPLAVWLQKQPPRKDLVKPTFAQIEEIIGGELPRSAYEHRSWWANDTAGHVQSQYWLDVGWRVASVNFTTRAVRFARIRERQRAYIEFYGKLIGELRQKSGFEGLQPLPDGTNWYLIKNVDIENRRVAAFSFSFGRGDVFRVEMYIDSGDGKINKRLFDLLRERKAVINEALGYELVWQRLDNRRASHVARFLQGSITDAENKLAQLRAVAVPSMVTLTKVLTPHVLELGQRVLAEKGL